MLFVFQSFSLVRTRLAPALFRPLTATPARFSSSFEKKEHTHENEFVARQERQALKTMLARLEKQADPDQASASAALEKLFTANNVKLTPKLRDALLEWRHSFH